MALTGRIDRYWLVIVGRLAESTLPEVARLVCLPSLPYVAKAHEVAYFVSHDRIKVE